ncbi:MAG: UbiX family flavin prenyltransferase [Bacteroidetes bacterium]|nr:UbiX family flavin prenyltransferase [Bacteroidota bacterium]
MKVTLAITGASGSIYARQLIQCLIKQDVVESITVICSKNGLEVMDFEGEFIPENEKVTLKNNKDFYSHTVSGSSCDDVMIIIPCSVGMMSRIAGGISDDVISRSADVILKERRKIIFVVRETPLNIIHIRNMQTLSEAGAIIMPASPSFYSKPQNIEDVAMTVTNRVMSLLGFKNDFSWGK